MVGRMALQLILSAPADDPGLGLKTHTRHLTIICNSSSQGSDPFFCRAQDIHIAHMLTGRQNIQTHKIKFKKKRLACHND